MITFNNIANFNNPVRTIVTIGTFDGVHIGHRKIIQKLVAGASANDLKSTLLTFFPHPRMVLQQDSDLKLITTLKEKQQILEKTGLDQLIVEPFTREFSRYTAQQFVKEILVDKLHVYKMVIGHNHRFGRNRTATIKDLIEFGNTFGFDVEQISAEEINEVSVSSTKIRNALNEGDITTANAYLGYEFMLTGIIEHGKGLGRQIDFPTANLKIEEDYKLIPANGVYVVKSTLNNKLVYGMMNIGFNPTVNGTTKTVEINFFDFNADLYGQQVQVHLLSRLRNEERFDSVDILKKQLKNDRKNALEFIQKRK
ncbi:bifunctional riboflavin kinase/FAD synthetase [Ascidiimonas sp. W6]|uniref:bifunctional riboflavin kinase/FAD synthetase n=1 Tax=Ascidiimonas meishanensis TaxID=3128903 RepID=UPI0030EC09E3